MADTDDSGFSEKELLLFVLVAVALLMAVSTFVLVLRF
jgi:uncharacterized membrane protein YwzB